MPDPFRNSILTTFENFDLAARTQALFERFPKQYERFPYSTGPKNQLSVLRQAKKKGGRAAANFNYRYTFAHDQLLSTK